MPGGLHARLCHASSAGGLGRSSLDAGRTARQRRRSATASGRRAASENNQLIASAIAPRIGIYADTWHATGLIYRCHGTPGSRNWASFGRQSFRFSRTNETFFARQAILTCRAYATSMTSVFPSVTLMDFCHIVEQKVEI